MACQLAIVPPRSDPVIARAVAWLLGITIALMTLAAFGILLSRTLELNGGVWATLFTDMYLALTVTHFGHIWLWRIPALALLGLAWSWNRRHPQQAWPSWLMVVAVAAIALTRSETGHPADHGDFVLAVWIDWAHMLAAGTWVGSLFGMTLAVYPKLLRAGQRSARLSAQLFQRLSTVSGAAFAVLLGCGIYNVVRQLGPVSSLWTSRYGITLDVKLALVLVMLAIGAHNRYLKLPRLRSCAGLPAKPSLFSRWLRRLSLRGSDRDCGQVLRSCAHAVLIESLLGVAVIGATGTLIHARPPADAPAMHNVPSATPEAPNRPSLP